MHFFTNFINEFISKKLGKGKKTIFIQFITFGLFVGVTVFTYVPKDTDPLTIIGAIIIFWIILYTIVRLLQLLKIL